MKVGEINLQKQIQQTHLLCFVETSHVSVNATRWLSQVDTDL